MTGDSEPKYRTDDIRRSFGALLDTRLFKSAVTTGILLVSLALLIRSFGFGGATEEFCDIIVGWATAFFTVEISLLMIAQRVSFLGKVGNAALFLITGIALFTPFDCVLMLRLFPLLRDSVRSLRIPRPLALAITPFWLIACLAGAARDYAIYENTDCTGWASCIGAASGIAIP